MCILCPILDEISGKGLVRLECSECEEVRETRRSVGGHRLFRILLVITAVWQPVTCRREMLDNIHSADIQLKRSTKGLSPCQNVELKPKSEVNAVRGCRGHWSYHMLFWFIHYLVKNYIVKLKEAAIKARSNINSFG